MSKSVTMYRASNGYIIEDDDKVYIGTITKVMEEFTAANPEGDIDMTIEDMAVPEMDADDIVVTPTGNGYKLFTPDEAFVFMHKDQLDAKLKEISDARIAAYAAGTDYTFTFPIAE